MGNVGAQVGGHVTRRAIRLVGVMLRTQPGVASQAFLAIKRNPLLGRWRTMRIVATHARHRRARLLLARALRQRLELTRRSQAGLALVRPDVIPNVVGEIVPGPELIQVLARSFNRSIALQVTLHADGIAPISSKLRRIDDGPATHVRRSGP